MSKSPSIQVSKSSGDNKKPFLGRQDFILIEMDKFKIFHTYMKHNNLDEVLKSIKESIMH